MKIAYIVPGSGDAFYCENCRRDLPLIRTLRELGHDVLILPLYMPVSCCDDELRVSEKIYCGALSMSLRSAFPFLRDHLEAVSRFLDARPLLDLMPRFSGLTRTRGLESLTLSMIGGNELFRKREFDDLVSFLEAEKPDFIHLSNFLLAGIGIELRKRLPVRLSCTLQDEDSWITAMREPYGRRAWNLMREQANRIDLFLPVSGYYAAHMGRLLEIDGIKMKVVPPALDLGSDEDGTGQVPVPDLPPAPAIGFLSRTSEENGLDDLAEAYLRLRSSIPRLRLLVAGGKTSDDNAFLAGIRRKLRSPIRSGDVVFLRNPDRIARKEFFRNVSVLSVPVKTGSAFGTFILESLAEGVPVVQPASGAYPEILGKTGGGLLSEPGSAESLAANLEKILSDRDYGMRLGSEGRENVRLHFSKAASASAFVSAFVSVSGFTATGDSRSADAAAGESHREPASASVESGYADADAGASFRDPAAASASAGRPGGGMLVLDNVVRTFRNSDGSPYAEVLKGLSFSLDGGESVAVMGPSGCGKSTLLRICGLLEPPDSGYVSFHGERTGDWSPDEAARFRNLNIGFVFQEHGLLPELTVLENVLLPSLASSTPSTADRKRFRERAEYLLDLMGIPRLRDRFPAELSAGERQRTAIARAGLMNPGLILADEPTAALDRKNADLAAAYLRKLADSSGAAVLLATHDQRVADVMGLQYDLSEGILEGRALV